MSLKYLVQDHSSDSYPASAVNVSQELQRESYNPRAHSTEHGILPAGSPTTSVIPFEPAFLSLSNSTSVHPNGGEGGLSQTKNQVDSRDGQVGIPLPTGLLNNQTNQNVSSANLESGTRAASHQLPTFPKSFNPIFAEQSNITDQWGSNKIHHSPNITREVAPLGNIKPPKFSSTALQTSGFNSPGNSSSFQQTSISASSEDTTPNKRSSPGSSNDGDSSKHLLIDSFGSSSLSSVPTTMQAAPTSWGKAQVSQKENYSANEKSNFEQASKNISTSVASGSGSSRNGSYGNFGICRNGSYGNIQGYTGNKNATWETPSVTLGSASGDTTDQSTRPDEDSDSYSSSYQSIPSEDTVSSGSEARYFLPGVTSSSSITPVKSEKQTQSSSASSSYTQQSNESQVTSYSQGTYAPSTTQHAASNPASTSLTSLTASTPLNSSNASIPLTSSTASIPLTSSTASIPLTSSNASTPMISSISTSLTSSTASIPLTSSTTSQTQNSSGSSSSDKSILRNSLKASYSGPSHNFLPSSIPASNHSLEGYPFKNSSQPALGSPSTAISVSSLSSNTSFAGNKSQNSSIHTVGDLSTQYNSSIPQVLPSTSTSNFSTNISTQGDVSNFSTSVSTTPDEGGDQFSESNTLQGDSLRKSVQTPDTSWNGTESSQEWKSSINNSSSVLPSQANNISPTRSSLVASNQTVGRTNALGSQSLKTSTARVNSQDVNLTDSSSLNLNQHSTTSQATESSNLTNIHQSIQSKDTSWTEISSTSSASSETSKSHSSKTGSWPKTTAHALQNANISGSDDVQYHVTKGEKITAISVGLGFSIGILILAVLGGFLRRKMTKKNLVNFEISRPENRALDTLESDISHPATEDLEPYHPHADGPVGGDEEAQIGSRQPTPIFVSGVSREEIEKYISYASSFGNLDHDGLDDYSEGYYPHLPQIPEQYVEPRRGYESEVSNSIPITFQNLRQQEAFGYTGFMRGDGMHPNDFDPPQRRTTWTADDRQSTFDGATEVATRYSIAGTMIEVPPVPFLDSRLYAERGWNS